MRAVALCVVALALTAATMVSANCIDPVTGHDFSVVPTTLIKITQHFGTSIQPYNYVINLCEAVSQPPSPSPPCPVPGFITEYDLNGGNCQTAWTLRTGITAVLGGVKFDYSQQTGDNHAGWTASIYVKCGNTLALQNGMTPQGMPAEVTVTGTSPALHFDFQLTTTAACGAPAPTSQPTLPPSTTPPQQGIALKVCDSSLSCGGSDCATQRYAVGCSPVGGNSSNATALRFCTGAGAATKLHVQVFQNSTSCAGNPSATSTYVLGHCVPHIETASSVELKECN